MVLTDEALANKIIYLKENGFMPMIEHENPHVINALQKFYFGSGFSNSCDSFWFRLSFTNYDVTDKFVRDVNREYKRYIIKNIGINEFDN